MTGENVVRALEVFLAANDEAVGEALRTQGQRVNDRRAKWQRAQDAWRSVVEVCGGCSRTAYAAIEAYVNGRML